MNPLALMSYLDAQNKARQRRDEQRNQFAQQNMQQQLGMAQMGMELRDKSLAREQQLAQFALTKQQAEQQAKLTAAQIAAAEREGRNAPVKERLAFLTPLVEPHAAYTAAMDAYTNYSDPTKTKVIIPSQQRKLLDAVRTSRSRVIAARDALGKLAQTAGMTDIDLDALAKNYTVDPLPNFMGLTKPTEDGGKKVGVLPTPGTGIAPEPTLPATSAVSPAASANMLGVPPSAFVPQTAQIPSSLYGTLIAPQLGVGVSAPAIGAVKPPMKPAARVAPKPAMPQPPPVVIPEYGETLKAFNARMAPYREAERGLTFSDLDEPEQKTVDTVAASMMKEVMDTFVPQTWDAKVSGIEHAQKGAADFFAHGTSEKMINRLLSKYATGDASVMKSVILDRFLNGFNEFSLPATVTERLVKSAKDVLDIKKDEESIKSTVQARTFGANAEKRAQTQHQLDIKAKTQGIVFDEKTAKTREDMLKQQATNAVTEGLIQSERLAQMQREAKAGKKVNYVGTWGSAQKLFDSTIFNPIDKVVTAVEEGLKLRLRGMTGARNNPERQAIDNQLALLTQVRAKVAQGPTQEYISAINNNQSNGYTLLQQQKSDILKDVVAVPALAPYFRDIVGSSSSGMPGNN